MVDPTWPGNIWPMSRHLHDPADVDAPHSLYVDKDNMEVKRIDRDVD